MEEVVKVRRAVVDDAPWIVHLSSRVEKKLKESGSLQHIGPLSSSMVQLSIEEGFAFLLEKAGSRIGSVFVEPLDGHYPNTSTIQNAAWRVEELPTPLWYLQSLMIEPAEQGKSLGLDLLDGIRGLMREQTGTILLDCWAGNFKLREFYIQAGFTHHGIFRENDYEIAVFFRILENQT